MLCTNEKYEEQFVFIELFYSTERHHVELNDKQASSVLWPLDTFPTYDASQTNYSSA